MSSPSDDTVVARVLAALANVNLTPEQYTSIVESMQNRLASRGFETGRCPLCARS